MGGFLQPIPVKAVAPLLPVRAVTNPYADLQWALLAGTGRQ